ncbi:MAG TPA: CHAT domain-containing tetratricopeptide repeat protein [Steroidobacteraceae bacterium]|nr:CHAT domain-containing tetratricopeptide repeat protein [Steroidobacteraceae bacterium]
MWPASAGATEISCIRALGTQAVPDRVVRTVGTEPSGVELAVAPRHAYLIVVDEQGNDALVEVRDAQDQLISRADHPERRSGTRRALVTSPESGSLTVRVSGKEHAGAAGTATIRAFDLAALEARPDCLAVMRGLAQADGDYAAGQEISSGRASAPGVSARDAFLRAAGGYATAERALTAPGDRKLRGEVQLALAGVEYLDLQDWARAADWASAAAGTLKSDDPYRSARAEALLAEAWVEIGRGTPAGQAVAGLDTRPSDLLTRARRTFERLHRFHLKRGETYDAALQLNYLAVADTYQSRFSDCVAVTRVSSDLFAKLHESAVLAVAWQDRAMCLWGLGRVPQAREWFERALGEIGPQPYPRLYLAVMNNTALLDYAVGRFDESLQLFDRALSFAQRTQALRDQGQTLYGIGVTYYALGDRRRAREFLERSLAIRSAQFDRRGRVNTLRALATIDADEGRVEEAIALDREALGLAVEPTYTQRIRIQLAVHTAAAGRPDDARAQLERVIVSAAGSDPLIQAEALLQRGVLLRKMGQTSAALADLAAARPRLKGLGSVSEEFAARLELARTLRLAGEPRAALAAVDAALGESAALRLQSADPALRSELEAPLRAAYDLKIELLRARFDAAVAAGRRSAADSLAAAAFAAADASRARTLADVAAQQYSPAIRRALAGEFRRREELYQDLAGRRYALEARRDSAGSNDERVRHMLAAIAELERQVDTVNARIAARTNAGGGRQRAAADAVSPPRVPAGRALVSYWLGAESAYAWVVQPTGIHWIRLAAPAAIAGRATAFYRSLTRLVDVPLATRREDGEALYRLILEPLEPWLQDVRPWLIIPDGALDYVPFAALVPTAGKAPSFVVMRHDVAFAPAAWMLEAQRNRPPAPARRALLLVADPVYQADDPRLATVRSGAVSSAAPVRGSADAVRPDLQRLPFTAREAAAIAAQFPPAEVDELTGTDATRARLLSLDWSRYRFIHIATHGTVDAQVPELSALVLGAYDARGSAVDGAVRVADLSTRTLDADVAVFSACQTALGKEVPSEGLLGIGSTVLARGARAVVASLWPVSDEIGAQLMTEFYRHLLHDSMSPPGALGAAMRSIVSRDPTADPALWAAFQVTTISP